MEQLTEFLKAERLSRNLTLEFVSERSGISASMLRSFEEGDFERFGASVLIRNTVIAYCRVLDLDSAALLEKHARHIEDCSIQARGIKKYGEQMKILRKKRRMISFPLLVLVILSAGVFYGGMWISDKRSKLYAPPAPDRIFTQEELPAELQQKLGPAAKDGPQRLSDFIPPAGSVKPAKPAVGPRDADSALRNAEIHLNEAEKDKGEQKAREAKISGQQPAPVKPEKPAEAIGPLGLSNSTEAVADDRPLPAPESKYKLAVVADDKVWIQVTIDDKGSRSAMLRPGDKMEWVADKSMQVVVGNAGGIRMKWNDRPVPAPRDPGRVLRFKLPDYVRDAG